MWSPFAHLQPAPDEGAEQQADAERKAREERIDQRIRAAVADAVAEPGMTERIRNAATGRRGRHADRLFGAADSDDGPEAA